MHTVREIVHPDAMLARRDVDELKAHIIWSSALKNGQEWTWGHSQIWWLVAMRKWMCKRAGRVLVGSHSLWLQHIQDSQNVFQTLSTLWSSVWHPKWLMIIFNISIWIHYIYSIYIYIHTYLYINAYIRVSVYIYIYYVCVCVISTYKRIYIYIWCVCVCVYCPITVQSSINRFWTLLKWIHISGTAFTKVLASMHCPLQIPLQNMPGQKELQTLLRGTIGVINGYN